MCVPTAFPFYSGQLISGPVQIPSGAAFPRPPALLVKSLRFIRDCSGSGLFLALAALTPPSTLVLFQSLSAPALLRTCNLWDSEALLP